MGMFDVYLPQPPLHCSFCGKEIEEWQGKDGPCGLFVWKQEIRHPVNQRVGKEIELEWGKLEEVELPQEFVLYARCCDQPFFLEAIGQKQDEIWSRTRLLGAEDVEKYHWDDPKEQRTARRLWLEAATM